MRSGYQPKGGEGGPKGPPPNTGSAVKRADDPGAYPGGEPPFSDKQRIAYTFWLLGTTFTRVGLCLPRSITFQPGELAKILAAFAQEGPPDTGPVVRDGKVTLLGIELREP